MLGKKTFLGYLPEPTYLEHPLNIDFPLYVNANPQVYGKDGLPEPFDMQIHFSGTTHFFYNADTNVKLNTDPLVISLVSLPQAQRSPHRFSQRSKPQALSRMLR